jgi:hypothetical protein
MSDPYEVRYDCLAAMPWVVLRYGEVIARFAEPELAQLFVEQLNDGL